MESCFWQLSLFVCCLLVTNYNLCHSKKYERNGIWTWCNGPKAQTSFDLDLNISSDCQHYAIWVTYSSLCLNRLVLLWTPVPQSFRTPGVSSFSFTPPSRCFCFSCAPWTENGIKPHDICEIKNKTKNFVNWYKRPVNDQPMTNPQWVKYRLFYCNSLNPWGGAQWQ